MRILLLKINEMMDEEKEQSGPRFTRPAQEQGPRMLDPVQRMENRCSLCAGPGMLFVSCFPFPISRVPMQIAYSCTCNRSLNSVRTQNKT